MRRISNREEELRVILSDGRFFIETLRSFIHDFFYHYKIIKKYGDNAWAHRMSLYNSYLRILAYRWFWNWAKKERNYRREAEKGIKDLFFKASKCIANAQTMAELGGGDKIDEIDNILGEALNTLGEAYKKLAVRHPEYRKLNEVNIDSKKD